MYCYAVDVRIPRTHLLNASSNVEADGTFKSSISRPRDRYAMQMLRCTAEKCRS